MGTGALTACAHAIEIVRFEAHLTVSRGMKETCLTQSYSEVCLPDGETALTSADQLSGSEPESPRAGSSGPHRTVRS